MDLYRHVLKLYPRSVRDEYGVAMRQLHRDLRVHGRAGGVRLFLATTRDVVGSAPRLRWEEGMADHPGRTRGIITMLVAIGFIALAAMGPILAVPLLVVLLVYMLRHRDDVRAAGQSGSWWVGLPVAGAILLLFGGIAAAILGDAGYWWLLAVVPLILGSVTIVVTLVLMALHEVRVHFFHRPQLVERRARIGGASVALFTLAVLFVVLGESRGWAVFMTLLVSSITVAFLGLYALLLKVTRPRSAAAI
ncbi:MAG TPA: hypothetical protein VMK16_17085 [Acidimicrobiales bacterium]|nr:hypothetical protein [Acidimicrobiales bacterium]